MCGQADAADQTNSKADFSVVVNMGPAFGRRMAVKSSAAAPSSFNELLSFENMLEQMESRVDEAKGNVDLIKRVLALLAKMCEGPWNI